MVDYRCSRVSSAEGPLAIRELGKGWPARPAPERAVGHRAGREETRLLLGEQACDTYVPTPLCVPKEKGVLWRVSSPTTAPGMDVWSARPNDGIPSNRFPTATPVGAARSAARYCGSYRGSLANSLGREPPRGQSDSLDENGRSRLHGVVVRALWALPTLEPSTRRRAHHIPSYRKSHRGRGEERHNHQEGAWQVGAAFPLV